MTGQTLLAIQARALDIAIAEITGDDEQLATFLEYCNQAIHDLEQYAAWPWLERSGTVSTVAEADTADLPSDFKGFLESSKPYYADGGWLLRGVDVSAIHRKRAAGATSGRPECWALEADPTTGTYRLTFWPTPDDAYAIIVPYRRLVTKLAASEDVVLVPAAMEQALKLLAMCTAEEGHEKIARSQFRDRAEAALAQAAWSPIQAQQQVALQPAVAGGDVIAECLEPMVYTVAAPLEPD